MAAADTVGAQLSITQTQAHEGAQHIPPLLEQISAPQAKFLGISSDFSRFSRDLLINPRSEERR
ncbi:MAG: hypothetical protein VCE12_05490, partial [Candidatus Latescibacterota bacterium]